MSCRVVSYCVILYKCYSFPPPFLGFGPVQRIAGVWPDKLSGWSSYRTCWGLRYILQGCQPYGLGFFASLLAMMCSHRVYGSGVSLAAVQRSSSLGGGVAQFGGQEPGSNADIKKFAAARGATFPLTTKVDVNGSNGGSYFVFLDAFSWNSCQCCLLPSSAALLPFC